MAVALADDAVATMAVQPKVAIRVVRPQHRSAAVTLAVQRKRRPAVAMVAELMCQLLLLSRSQCRQLQWLIPRRSSTHAVQLSKPAALFAKLWFATLR